MAMSSVEQAIQLQIQDIAAVKQSFSASLEARQPDTLWWLVDSTSNIIYENRVKGSSILAIDQNVDAVSIASLYSDWFNLQNAYFSQDQPYPGLSTLQSVIATIYRWRVPQYFNDIASVASGQGVAPQYVFPYQDMNLGTYAITGTAFTKGVGPVNAAVCGPGILSVVPYLAAIGVAAINLTLTAVYPDGTTGTLTATVPSGSDVTDSIAVGGTALTGAYTAATDAGVVNVASVTGFKIGPLNLVVITENTTVSGQLPSWTTEVAEIAAVGSNQLTLRQPTPPGAANPFSNGLRNNYTTAAMVFPLFNDVNAVSSTGGTAGDQVQISFYPDWAQGFVDVTSIVVPQGLVESSEDTSDTDSDNDESVSQRPTRSPKSPPPPPILPPHPPHAPPPPPTRPTK
jgi:hypothetical protein